MDSLHRLGKKSATYDKRDLQFVQCCTTASLPPEPKQFGHERLITANAWQMLGDGPDTVSPELKGPSNCVFVRGEEHGRESRSAKRKHYGFERHEFGLERETAGAS
jgi:hypothetical protein